jgi:hypothetical protein
MSKDKLGYKKSILNGHKQFENPSHTWKEIATCMTPNREDLRRALIREKKIFNPKKDD